MAETNTGTEVPAEHGAGGGFPPFEGSTFAAQLIWLVLAFGLLYVAVVAEERQMQEATKPRKRQ